MIKRFFNWLFGRKEILDVTTILNKYGIHTLVYGKAVPQSVDIDIGTLSIKSDGPTPLGATVLVGGKKLPIRSLKLEGAVDSAWQCTIEYYPGLVLDQPEQKEATPAEKWVDSEQLGRARNTLPGTGKEAE